MGQQVAELPTGPEASRNAFGSRLEHNNGTATTGETTITFSRAAGRVKIANTGGTNALLVSFDGGATFWTIGTNSKDDFFGNFPSLILKSAAATTTFEVLG